MNQDKKGFSNWWWLVILGIAYGFGTAMVHEPVYELGSIDDIDTTIQESTEVQPDWSLAVVDGDHNTNECRFATTTMFNETVTIYYPDFNPEDSVTGRWDPNTNVLQIMQPEGLTIKTVSHEVSHMVDTFMFRYPDIDPHYEAYMQGFWTWCVWEVMMHDIRRAEEMKAKLTE